MIFNGVCIFDGGLDKRKTLIKDRKIIINVIFLLNLLLTFKVLHHEYKIWQVLINRWYSLNLMFDTMGSQAFKC